MFVDDISEVPNGGTVLFSAHGVSPKVVADAAARIGKLPTVEAIATSDYPTPAKRPANSVLDCAKLARVYGLKLRRWEDGLAEMLAGTLT